MTYDEIQERELIHRNMKKHYNRHKWKEFRIQVYWALAACALIGLITWIAGHPAWLR